MTFWNDENYLATINTHKLNINKTLKSQFHETYHEKVKHVLTIQIKFGYLYVIRKTLYRLMPDKK